MSRQARGGVERCPADTGQRGALYEALCCFWLHRQQRQVAPDGASWVVGQFVGTDAFSNEIVVVDNVEDALVAVLRADILDFVNAILRAADGALESQDMITH